jgi:predicted nucleotidyltransferase
MGVKILEMQSSAVADLCRRHHIRRLAVFGSAVRDQLRPDSDVDILVEFEQGYTPGFAFFDIQEELSRIMGRRADLNTPGFLSPDIRRKVEAEAEVVFAGD